MAITSLQRKFILGLIVVSGVFASSGLAYSNWQQRQATIEAQNEMNLALRFIASLVAHPPSCFQLIKDSMSKNTPTSISYLMAVSDYGPAHNFVAYDFTRGSIGLPESNPLIYFRSVNLEISSEEKTKANLRLNFESPWNLNRTHIIPLKISYDSENRFVGCELASPNADCSLHDDACVDPAAPRCLEVSDNGLDCPALPDSTCQPFFYASRDEASGESQCNCAWRCNKPRKSTMRGKGL